MTTTIRRFIWTLRCARALRRHGGMPLRQAWDVAVSCHEQYAAEGFSPTDAAWEEMSYWSE
ncbi:hypothetical protein K6W26_22900 [Burkholderia sp. AU42008]|uniref:hypothetical protein n=1 Tax=unclassified Burkholderia TaxID=2613784 RepID=UPI001177EDA4|nr:MULTISPECIES: hypothetical protein [unclassified Burkholderia]MBR8234652.1 hypothetical protein [Burkholderia sp. AU32357]MBY4875905.1 hypothetical protein [Burkholderia sp. AU42008]